MPTHDVAKVGSHHAWIPSPEVFSGITSILWGVLSFWTADPISDRKPLHFMSEIAPDWFWESAFIVVGLAQLAAVFLHVRPMRFFCAFALASLYAMMTESYLAAGAVGVPTIAIVIVMCVGMNLCAALAYTICTIWIVSPRVSRLWRCARGFLGRG